MSILAMEMGRSLWLALLITAILVSSCHSEASTADGQTATAGGPPDTNVLCVSRCGTCPTVCSSPPPPSSPESGGGDYSSSSPPRSSTSPPPSPLGQQPQTKGGRSSNYYYFFTAGSGRSCAASSAFYYTLPLLALLSLFAV